MSQVLYFFEVVFPKETREEVLEKWTSRFWQEFSEGDSSFQGAVEGVVLSEEAHERGLETESWVLDAGLAPHERDWVREVSDHPVQFFFLDEDSAKKALDQMKNEDPTLSIGVIQRQEPQDWNAKWKESFQGIDVNGGLKVLPPWKKEEWESDAHSAMSRVLWINPGAGFGTGTHETTQLCLEFLQSIPLKGKRVLDFGSGSGILGIYAATQGATVHLVEIDPLANENAMENAALNQVKDHCHWYLDVKDAPGEMDVLVANILRPILIQFAPEMIKRLKPHSPLVLSGLIESDLPEVIRVYQSIHPHAKIETRSKGEWRALLITSDRQS